jgi:iron complex outermembrane receptor protein
VFARAEWTAAQALDLTADLALRHQAYRMRGDQFDGIAFDEDYTFLLPRVGASWRAGNGLQLFGSWAASRREPAFRDLYDAEGVGSVPLYRVVDIPTNTYEDPLVKPERVSDWELGARWQSSRAALIANLFHMDFEDELVYAGQFNTDLGYPTVGNAARSVHRGIELEGRLAFGAAVAGANAANGTRSGFDLAGNLSLGDHEFREYQEVYGTAPGDTLRYDGNAIGFFPQTMANLLARWSMGLTSVALEAQYAGRIYVDNTETESASIAPRTVLNLAASQGFHLAGVGVDLTLRLLNATDRSYETSGYMDYDATGALVPHLIPAAGRNWLGQVTFRF